MSELLPRAVWLARQAAHEDRVDRLTEAHRTRRASGHRSHPVEDFLFTYYRNSPAKLRRWDPGSGARLAGAAGMPRAGWTFYRTVGDDVGLDVVAFLERRGSTLRFVHELLTRTAARPAHLGLHEWAMVHRLGSEEVRHRGWPLRLGSAGTDEVVQTHQVRCTHFDAYRFFTESAAPLNALRPTRETQVELEQPGCLHAGMDLYKWAFKLSPAVPSELTADCFELARDIRVLDMRASPYDLTELGYEPVAIETAAGRAAYVTAQAEFSRRAAPLRERLVEVTYSLATTVEAIRA